MDRLIMILSHANLEVIKEPRGFIKFIQIIVAICAFATAVTNHSNTVLEVKCNTTILFHKQSLDFYYPYNLHESTKFETPVCQSHKNGTASCYGDFSTNSQFFVFVGVTAFLVCLVDLIFYVLADDKYHQVALIPTIDFVVTVIYAGLWFVSSSAWADGVVKIKHYTDPASMLLPNEYNKANLPECFETIDDCIADSGHPGDYRNMNISIVLGYLCVVLWIGNLWFLYKETKWYKDKMNTQQNDSQTPSSPSSAI